MNRPNAGGHDPGVADDQLVTLLRRGDSRAVEYLQKHLRARAKREGERRFGTQWASSDENIVELCNEVIVQVIQKLEKYDPTRPLVPYAAAYIPRALSSLIRRVDGYDTARKSCVDRLSALRTELQASSASSGQRFLGLLEACKRPNVTWERLFQVVYDDHGKPSELVRLLIDIDLVEDLSVDTRKAAKRLRDAMFDFHNQQKITRPESITIVSSRDRAQPGGRERQDMPHEEDFVDPLFSRLDALARLRELFETLVEVPMPREGSELIHACLVARARGDPDAEMSWYDRFLSFLEKHIEQSSSATDQGPVEWVELVRACLKEGDKSE